jgi:hypothetical protein
MQFCVRWLARHTPNVQVYLASAMTAQDIIDTGANRIVIATGSHWRRDGVARYHRSAIAELDGSALFTPDDVMDGVEISGPVISMTTTITIWAVSSPRSCGCKVWT